MSCLCFVCLNTYSLVRQVYMNNMVDVEAGAADHSVFWLGTMLLICLVVCVVFCFVLFVFILFLVCPTLLMSLDCTFLTSASVLCKL